MKTRTSIALLASGLFAAAALAGPGPQYGQQMEKIRMENAAKQKTVLPVKMDEHPTGKCDGCKTTPIWVFSDRGPAGKGVPGARVTGYMHSCTGCIGKNVTENGKMKSGMKHAPNCAALGCCK